MPTKTYRHRRSKPGEDKLPSWLNEYLPRSPERLKLVRMIRHRFAGGASRESLAAEFSLPLEFITRLCRYRANINACPKHDGSGLLACSSLCRGCAWEAAQIASLGPVPAPNGVLPCF